MGIWHNFLGHKLVSCHNRVVPPFYFRVEVHIWLNFLGLISFDKFVVSYFYFRDEVNVAEFQVLRHMGPDGGVHKEPRMDVDWVSCGV